MTCQLLNSFAKNTSFPIDPPAITNFVLTLQANYHPRNTYHNFWHAFNTMQVIAMWARSVDCRSIFEPDSAFALLCAALSHDIDHPGVSNRYLTVRKSLIALVYNDISVLENHHAALLCLILQDPDCNVMKALGDEAYQAHRKRMVNAILATDMAKHFDVVRRLQETQGDAEVPREERQARLDVPFLEMCLMHTADISNPMLPFELYRGWAQRVVMEFHYQNILEEEVGITVSMPMISNTDELNVAVCQIGFVGYICQPLMESLAYFFPKSIAPRVRVMLENKAKFEKIKEELSQEEK
jgi:hypothetical protein